jgi:hypothetical protein
MLITVFLLLAVGSFICTVAWALGKCPGWVPVLLLTVIELLRCLPTGR